MTAVPELPRRSVVSASLFTAASSSSQSSPSVSILPGGNQLQPSQHRPRPFMDGSTTFYLSPKVASPASISCSPASISCSPASIVCSPASSLPRRPLRSPARTSFSASRARAGSLASLSARMPRRSRPPACASFVLPVPTFARASSLAGLVLAGLGLGLAGLQSCWPRIILSGLWVAVNFSLSRSVASLRRETGHARYASYNGERLGRAPSLSLSLSLSLYCTPESGDFAPPPGSTKEFHVKDNSPN